MELDQFDEAVDVLGEAIAEFPVGAQTVDDFRPTEEKIELIRSSLKHLNARHIILKALIDGKSC